MADLVHRFSWLSYDHSGAAGHVGVLVAVCDCGWNDLTSDGQGTGIDAAGLYADHVKGTHNDGGDDVR